MARTRKSGFIGALTLLAALTAASALMVLLWPSLPARAQIAQLNVRSVADTGGNTCGNNCTLRQALNAANNVDPEVSTTINFDLEPSERTIELGSQLPAVERVVLIEGGGITVSGGGRARVFQVNRGGGLALAGLTVIDGDAGAGGSGGGVFNVGKLEVSNSTFSGNSAGDNGGGIYNGQGSFLSVNNSTFSGNSAPGGLGGAIYTDDVSNADVTNSTFSGNSAAEGGGIYNGGSSPLGVTYSTFSKNSASAGTGIGGAVSNEDAAGAATTLSSTILAGGPSGGNCEGGITDGAFNISDDPTCFFTAQGSRNSTDPFLDPGGLKNNGGPTQTIALVSGGPAVNAVPQATNGCGTDVDTDQRRVTRPQGPRCDVGAFELQAQQGGEECTKKGTAGRDVLVGSRGKDVLCGRGGGDVLIGLGGTDTLLGGRGRDVLLGVDGVRGNDSLDGRGGTDLCLSDRGDERASCERPSVGFLGV